MNNSSSGSSNSSDPLVSIVTPSYNQAQFIEKTIRSVLLQDYVNLEYYVLDAMSMDGTEQILDKYAQSITRAIRAKDDGQADAINKGFQMCSGEIMAYINSDDCYATPQVVSRVVQLFKEHPEVDVIYGKREYIDEAGYFVLNYPFRDFDGKRLLEACYLPQECAFWRRSIFEKAGNMCNPAFKFAMDYDLWLRFLKAKGKFLAVDEYFGLFRWYPGQKSNDVWVKHGVPEIGRLQKQHLGRVMPEDEMVASYQEYWYGVNRIKNPKTFTQSVRVWNTFMTNKKEMLSGLTRDAWVFMNSLDIPDRSGVVELHRAKIVENRSTVPGDATLIADVADKNSTTTDGANDSGNSDKKVALSGVGITRSGAVAEEAQPEMNFETFHALVEKFNMFEPAYYLSQIAHPVDEPLKHYFESGWKFNLNPHHLFDASYYLESNSNVKARRQNPLIHWVEKGALEERDPHPLFKISHYRKNVDGVIENAGLVRHFLEHGWKAGLSPHPLFDSAYCKKQIKGFDDTNPFEKFLNRGDFSLTPHPLFAPEYYARQTDTDISSSVEALIHYCQRGWKDGLSPYPLFDVPYYSKFFSESEPLEHYLQEGYRKGLNPHVLFDSEFYILQRAALRSGYMSPLEHYVTRGLNYGVSPHKDFDTTFYEQCEPDSLKDLTVPAMVRYLKNAFVPGIDPNSNFDTDFYCDKNPGLKESGAIPLAHYSTLPEDRRTATSPFYDAYHCHSRREAFLAACQGKVIWNFLPRAECEADGSNRLEPVDGVTSIEISPTQNKFRSGTSKSRGLQFKVHSGDASITLCFDPTKQLMDLQKLFVDSQASKLILHNFLGADRALKDFLEKFRQPFSVYLSSEDEKIIAQEGIDTETQAILLAQALSNGCMGDGVEYRPLNMFNWVASRLWFVKQASEICTDSPAWQKFFAVNFPSSKVCNRSFAVIANDARSRRLVKEVATKSSSTRGKIRVGIPCLPGSGWTGGIHYLNGLMAAAASSSSSSSVEFVLIAKRNSEWQTFASLLKGWTELAEVTELSNGWELDSLGLDCIFAAGGLIAECKTPVLSWLYDFQHMELPGYFSKQDIADRNQLFDVAMQTSSKVVLSSNHARSICEQIYPQYAGKTSVLPFAANLPEEAFTLDSSYVKEKYHLPDVFFYLPNQFWLHKNHECVVDALAIAKAQGSNVVVVCTGSTNDSRSEDFFSRLLEKVAVNGLLEQFLILGLIPRADVWALYKESRSVLQPSLYEGWSTSVEEAKSLDLSIVLSDIPVHREQNPDKAVFFSPFDSKQLAQLLIEQNSASTVVGRSLNPSVRSNNASSFKAFGADFNKLVESLTYSPVVG